MSISSKTPVFLQHNDRLLLCGWPLLWARCATGSIFNVAVCSWTGKQINRCWKPNCCLCLKATFPPGFQRYQWSSACWAVWKSTVGMSCPERSLSVRLPGAPKPLEGESIWRGAGGTSWASSINCSERDGTEERRCGGDAWESACVCQHHCGRVCVWLQTFSLCVLAVAVLAVGVWLKMWGNEQRKRKEQNLESRTKAGRAQMTQRRMTVTNVIISNLHRGLHKRNRY